MTCQPGDKLVLGTVLLKLPLPDSNITLDHCSLIMPDCANFVISRNARINTLDKSKLALYPRARRQCRCPCESFVRVRLENFGECLIRRRWWEWQRCRCRQQRRRHASWSGLSLTCWSSERCRGAGIVLVEEHQEVIDVFERLIRALS